MNLRLLFALLLASATCFAQGTVTRTIIGTAAPTGGASYNNLFVDTVHHNFYFYDGTWRLANGGGGGGTPCTTTASSLQFDDAGSFGCIPSSTYNKTTGILQIGSGLNVDGVTGGRLDFFAHDGDPGTGTGGDVRFRPGSGDTNGTVRFLLAGTTTTSLAIDAVGNITSSGSLALDSTISSGNVGKATGSLVLNGVTSGTATIGMADTTSNVTMTGGQASMVVCWKADGISLGFATVAEITSGTCH